MLTTKPDQSNRPEIVPVEYIIPNEMHAVFTDSTVARKKRMSLLIKWFMQNWYMWEAGEIPMPMSIPVFANALSHALYQYGIVINPQRVWTWISMRNLPRIDNFHVMSKIATGWQREFALLVLYILASPEPSSESSPEPSSAIATPP